MRMAGGRELFFCFADTGPLTISPPIAFRLKAGSQRRREDSYTFSTASDLYKGQTDFSTVLL
jgi:hypothetical protein